MLCVRIVYQVRDIVLLGILIFLSEKISAVFLFDQYFCFFSRLPTYTIFFKIVPHRATTFSFKVLIKCISIYTEYKRILFFGCEPSF